MLCKSKDSKAFTILGGTKGWLYPSSPKKDQTIAYVEMKGDYPPKGFSMNDICTETLFLIDGKIDVQVDGVWNTLEKNDLIMILPRTKYRIRGEGKIIDLITPAWDKDQNHIIEE